MATYAAVSIDNINVESIKLDYVTISGTVRNTGGVPLKREIIVFKYPIFETPHKTYSSDVDGSWSIELKGGINDRFMAIAVGIPGEETQIFDFLTE